MRDLAQQVGEDIVIYERYSLGLPNSRLQGDSGMLVAKTEAVSQLLAQFDIVNAFVEQVLQIMMYASLDQAA